MIHSNVQRHTEISSQILVYRTRYVKIYIYIYIYIYIDIYPGYSFFIHNHVGLGG